MKYKVARNNKLSAKRLVLLVAFIGVLAALLALFLLRRVPLEKKVQNTFHKDVSSLSQSVTDLPKFLEKSESVKIDLETYDSMLSSMQGICGQLQRNYSVYKDASVSQPLKDSMAKVGRICTDLVPVVKYSQDLYRATTPYLLIDGSEWPTANTNDFSTRLKAANEGINISLSRLKQVNNSVKDPAFDELMTQLELSANLITDVQTANSNEQGNEANNLAAKLLNQTNQDKSDFLSARLYFWNNTVQRGALQNALAQLQDDFSN
jgi:hypothetical protein